MKRLFTFLSLIAFMGSSFPPAATTSAQEPSSSFSDVYSDHEYLGDIEYLKEHNIVQGYEVNVEGEKVQQFRPDYQINRAELTKIMIEAQYTATDVSSCLEDKKTKGLTEVYFSDVKIDDWFAGYVCVAKEKGIISGYADGTFRPADAVNFAEAAKIIVNALKLFKKTAATNEEWYVPFAKSLETRKGIPESIRSFNKVITRGEMARMIHAAKEVVSTPGQDFSMVAQRSTKEAELPQIDSCDALIEKLSLDDQQGYYPPMADGFGDMAGRPESVATPAPTGAMNGGEGALREQSTKNEESSADYSETNVQVKGVDEADVIKNDGKYIYMIRGNTVRIIDAYPGSGMKEVASIEVDDTDFSPMEMYVDENQMVIIGHVYRYRDYPTPMPLLRADDVMMEKMAIWPGPSFDSTRMKVYVYDIRDRSKPKKERSVEIEGNYANSRKVGKNVYFVLNQYIPYYSIQEGQPADVILPRYKDSAEGDVEKPLTRCMGIQYFPNFVDRNYMIVMGLNLANDAEHISKKVLLGSSQNIYASPENLYVATQQWQEVRQRDGRDIYYDSVASTLVYRFKLAQQEIEYQNQGSVPGTILNQFSMDESGDDFRIATESNMYNPTSPITSSNSLFVLNKDSMQVIGKIDGIAPNEHIKSVRFMGKRAYMVTFKNVDPLFVIDLSDSTSPKILGQLKIPGWSDYLHPYDETHLIGFGRDVDASIDADKVHSDDAVYYTAVLGMKLSLFDVSDVSNPKEMFNEIIGTRGTTSELLTNHKALLFDKEKNLLAFPITITEAGSKNSSGAPENINTVFSGGIVYSIDLLNGFRLKGKVTHYESDDVFLNSGEYFYGQPERNIQRMIYIGDYLYSISPDFVRSYTLSTVKPVTFIKLMGSQQDDVEYLDDSTPILESQPTDEPASTRWRY